jgi:hypothetical protein
MSEKESSAIFLGAHSRLYSESHYYRAFEPHGVSRKAFRRFLKALHVPVIYIGRQRFIDHLSFSLALRAISRIGQPDFLFPGCIHLASPPAPSNTTDTLDPAYVKRNLRSLLAELISTRVEPDSPATHRAFARAVDEAADRLSSVVVSRLDEATQAELADQVIARYAAQLDTPDPSTPEPRPLYED